jgi:hypothetical protein
MIHLVNHDYMNIENFEALVTSLEEAYGDTNRVNTTKRVLTKLCQGNRDFVIYYRSSNA